MFTRRGKTRVVKRGTKLRVSGWDRHPGPSRPAAGSGDTRRPSPAGRRGHGWCLPPCSRSLCFHPRWTRVDSHFLLGLCRCWPRGIPRRPHVSPGPYGAPASRLAADRDCLRAFTNTAGRSALQLCVRGRGVGCGHARTHVCMRVHTRPRLLGDPDTRWALRTLFRADPDPHGRHRRRCPLGVLVVVCTEAVRPMEGVRIQFKCP